MSHNTVTEGGGCTKYWTCTVAIDGSLNGAPGQYAAIGCVVVQLC